MSKSKCIICHGNIKGCHCEKRIKEQAQHTIRKLKEARAFLQGMEYLYPGRNISHHDDEIRYAIAGYEELYDYVLTLEKELKVNK